MAGSIQNAELRVAVVGMSVRLPGARTLREFWENLCCGVESITFFSREDLVAASIDPALVNHPNYVPARAILPNLEEFDSAFFGLSPREAALVDPQQRVLLECAWEALEDSGCTLEAESRLCGVYAGTGVNGYLLHNICTDRSLFESIGGFQIMLGNDKDFCATRISYKLNLNGPSLSVQTACSTSLVAVHLACQALLQGECDLALAGGCSAFVPQRSGYMYEPGMILSPDGHCRPFDAQANGTVPGSGAAMIVLKRLEDAFKDGDCIQAVILGSAINNDGAVKMGYTAPSAKGQRDVISEALSVAGASPDSIGYIEAHGTGTPNGDPIEFEALNQVFGSRAAASGKCVLSALKSNFGHLDVAAGVVGLIKAILALKNGVIPGTLHFERPNTQISFEQSAFFVPTRPAPWDPARCSPRRAGVSSFGIGGTNAHVVLEEAPSVDESARSSRRHQAFVVSAKSAAALAAAELHLIDYLREHPDCDVADVAFTLNTGRRLFPFRRLVTAADREQAIAQLGQASSSKDHIEDERIRSEVVFLFPGQGVQYANMARGLYEVEPRFRENLDRCCDILRPELGSDLRQILFQSASLNGDEDYIHQTRFAQPALFAVEYSLARCLMQWQVRPAAMLGHSLGEWVAACIAEVMELEDALRLIALRARLMQDQPRGAMLTVPLGRTDLEPYLEDGIDLAAINAPNLCVVAGPAANIEGLERKLAKRGVASIRLVASHAFHSAMMEPVMAPLLKATAAVKLRPPAIRFTSNVTGRWITAEEATDPAYWAKQAREPVRCAESLDLVLEDSERVLLEMGPGQVLSVLASRHVKKPTTRPLLGMFPLSRRTDDEAKHFVASIGRLHMAGVHLDWNAFHDAERRRRVSLPTYPFQRQRCWIDPVRPSRDLLPAPTNGEATETKKTVSEWFYLPGWRRSPLPQINLAKCAGPWLLIGLQQDERKKASDGRDLLSEVTTRLCERGAEIFVARAGKSFEHGPSGNYTVRPERSEDWCQVLQNLLSRGRPLEGIIILERSLEQENCQGSLSVAAANGESLCGEFFQLTALAQAIGRICQKDKVRLTFISRDLHLVTGSEKVNGRAALALGAIRVIPQEYENVECRNIDVDAAAFQDGAPSAARLLAEIMADSGDDVVAYRGAVRWVRSFESINASGYDEDTLFRERGVYLITGGLGGIGLTLAKHLAQSYRAKLILVSRSNFPIRQAWKHLSSEQQSRIGPQVDALMEIEATGGEVHVIQADVADETQMAEAIAKAEHVCGSISGVIHAAGVAAGGVLAGRTLEDARKVLHAKVQGLLVLERIFQGRQLDFLALCSSVTAWLGGFGQSDYCAANAFLNVYADHKQSAHYPIISIAWDTWREVGMAVKTPIAPELRRLRDEELQRFGIAPSEGITAFRQVLRFGLPQVIVSTREFAQRYAQQRGMFKAGISQLASITRGPRHPRPALAAVFVPPGNAFERRLAEHWCDNLGFTEIGLHDNYFDLGGDSLKGITLVSSLQKELGEVVHVAALFEAPTIAELTAYFAKHYPAATAKFRGNIQLVPEGEPLQRLDFSRIEQLRQRISALTPYPKRSAERNPPAAFILSAPRSGSTLLRVMLAGNAKLFAPPELALLSFNTLQQRKTGFSGSDESLLEGPVHALKHLLGCSPEEAQAQISEWERLDLSCKEVYLRLQRLLGDRLLVDKTPSYAYDLETLRRAEADFERPLYVHLVRHPCGMVSSYREAKLDLLLPAQVREGFALPRTQIAEAIWLISNENIFRFLEEVPDSRQYRLTFEHLLLEPQGEMERLSAFLGVEFQPEMLEPYREKRQRMTEGLHPNSRMLGDVNFHLHRGIEQQVAQKWRASLGEDSLSDLTRALAKRLNCDSSSAVQKENEALVVPSIKRSASDEDFGMSSGQRRLWFLYQLGGDTGVYHISAALRIRGKLDPDTLARCHREIVRRHETLRTAFTTRDGEPRQFIAPELPFELPVIDLGNVPHEEREIRARTITNDCVRGPFDFSHPPLLRAVLARFSEDEYLWVLTIHHIISDGWSVSVFMREMTALYRAFSAGEPSPLPDLPIQYVDYAAWQSNWLRSETVERQVSYWRTALAGAPALMPLPYDRPRLATQTNRGARLKFKLSDELSARVKAVAREAGGTLFTTLLAGFTAILSRYSGLDDIVVGTPTAGRHRPEFAPLIGFFVNTLVLRIDFSAKPTFRELLQQTRRVFLDAISHQDVPFEIVVEAVQPARDLSHTPLFQVVFGLRNIDTGELDWPGIRAEAVDIDHQSAAFDLTLLMKETSGGLIGDFEFNTDLFDESTVQNLARNFETLLRVAVEAPDTPLHRLEILDTLEQHRLLERFNTTEHLTEAPLLLQSFEKQAAETPESVALVQDKETLTYRKLNEHANRLARHLITMGVGPERLVGIALERSVEMVVALLGVLKTGAAYLPLDPDYPKARLAFMIRDASPTLVLSKETFRDRLPDFAPVLPVENVEKLPAHNLTNSERTCPLLPGHPAYVIYTSGSTGKPKGVVVQHQELANYLSWAKSLYECGAGSGTPINTPLAFDATVTSLYLPLITGQRIILLPETYSLEALAELLASGADLTLVKLTPAHLEALRGLLGPRISSVRARRFIVGGESLQSPLTDFWRANLPSVQIVNEYGPTETVVGCCVYELGSEAAPTRDVPIGRPAPNTRIYVLDESLTPVPIGVVGELCIAGDQLARGYLNRPELTAERFLADPHGKPGTRMYRTGDLGRWRADGTLEFLGRADQQVKIRGFRIEPAEIEAALTGLPEVAQVAVVAHKNGSADKKLVAYVAPLAGATIDSATLRRALRELLPDYMAPSVYVVLDKLPLTPNGKVDRAALPEPSVIAATDRGTIATPQTPMERSVAGIWQNVLSVEQIDIHENFFDLGGHSLLIIKVQAQLRKLLGLELKMVDLFRYTTVSSLAAYLNELQNTPSPLPKEGQHSHRLAQARAEKQKEATRRYAAAHAREHQQSATKETDGEPVQ